MMLNEEPKVRVENKDVETHRLTLQRERERVIAGGLWESHEQEPTRKGNTF